MTRRLSGLLGALLAAVAIQGGTAARADDEAAIRRRIDELRIPEAQLRWQRVPWVADVDEGLRLAREERRPILIWVSGDDPLERC